MPIAAVTKPTAAEAVLRVLASYGTALRTEDILAELRQPNRYTLELIGPMEVLGAIVGAQRLGWVSETRMLEVDFEHPFKRGVYIGRDVPVIDLLDAGREVLDRIGAELSEDQWPNE